MKRGPKPGSATTTDFLAIARNAWGDAMPAEVEALAHAAMIETATAAAGRIGYSPAVVTHVLRRSYSGDMTTVFGRIRGAFMGETVDCPVLGEIGRDRCLIEQKRPFAATNSSRARLWHACKTCRNRRAVMEAPDA
jgi:hypothetical protein